MSHEVFISYSRSVDMDFVDGLQRHLKEVGVSCFVDRHNIGGGEDYREVIVDAISRCLVFVVVMSKHTLGSKNVKKELGLAAEDDKFRIWIRREELELSGVFKYELTNFNRIDAFDCAPESLSRAALDIRQAVERRRKECGVGSPVAKNQEDVGGVDLLEKAKKVQEEVIRLADATIGGRKQSLMSKVEKAAEVARRLTDSAETAVKSMVQKSIERDFQNLSSGDIIDTGNGTLKVLASEKGLMPIPMVLDRVVAVANVLGGASEAKGRSGFARHGYGPGGASVWFTVDGVTDRWACVPVDSASDGVVWAVPPSLCGKAAVKFDRGNLWPNSGFARLTHDEALLVASRLAKKDGQ